ncbi:hypothetical protein D9M71_422930 [compost metagenome]
MLGGDEAGAEIGQVGAEHLRGEDLVAVVEAAGEQQGLVEELADLGDQGEGTPGPGVATGAGGNCDQAIDAGFRSFLGMTAGGHVVEHQAAVAVHGVHHFLHRAQAGDDDRDALLHADGQVGLQARVAVVDDEVDREGRGVLPQACFNFLQPGAEATALPLVQGREAADDAVVAARQDQLGVGHQEHRRSHDRQAQTLIEQGGQRHLAILLSGQKGLTTTRTTMAIRKSTGTSLNQR